MSEDRLHPLFEKAVNLKDAAYQANYDIGTQRNLGKWADADAGNAALATLRGTPERLEALQAQLEESGLPEDERRYYSAQIDAKIALVRRWITGCANISF